MADLLMSVVVVVSGWFLAVIVVATADFKMSNSCVSVLIVLSFRSSTTVVVFHFRLISLYLFISTANSCFNLSFMLAKFNNSISKLLYCPCITSNSRVTSCSFVFVSNNSFDVVVTMVSYFWISVSNTGITLFFSTNSAIVVSYLSVHCSTCLDKSSLSLITLRSSSSCCWYSVAFLFKRLFNFFVCASSFSVSFLR